MQSLFNISYLKKAFNDRKKYKYINQLLFFYVTYDVIIAFIAYKLLSENYNFPFLFFTTALISFAFIMDDIVAEIYGIAISAQFYFLMVLFRISAGVLLYVFTNNTGVTKYLLFTAFFHPLIYTVAWYINVVTLTKLKILIQGRYFWLRSIGSSGIVISIFCFFLIIEDTKFSTWSIHQIIFGDFIWSYCLRISFIVIFSFPANCLVNILKIIENKSFNETDFNPFKYSVEKL